MADAVGLVLFLLWASGPAAAAGDELQVIAVRTASAPRVSMVVQAPVTPPQNGSGEESCTVTIDGKPVAATVTPMASGDLSVALVIDAASDLTARELAAVQSGAAEFLIGLPEGAHTAVVAAGGEPQVVAPLSADRAEALSAISALRAGGSAATTAGTMLAAQSLESAPPGPRVIVVYAHGLDEQGPSVEQLSQAVLQAEAVVNVIPPDAESIWPTVVDRTGGLVLPPAGAADIAESYGRLATMLSEQYLLTFQAPGELPAVAQVAFQSGDQEYRTVVDLPEADTAQAAPTEGNRPSGAGGIAGLVPLVVAGLVLIGLVVLALLRIRRRASMGSSPPDEAPKPPANTPPAPALATSATKKQGGGPPSNGAPPSTVVAAPATSPPRPPSRRGSLSAAVQGRRSAEQAVESQLEQQIRHPTDDQQPRPEAPERNQPKPQAPTNERQDESRGTPLATRLSGIGSRIAARVAREEHSAPHGRNAGIVLTGSGNAVVNLTKGAPSPAAVRITGNPASRYFKVRALDAEDNLVNTFHPYHGVRPLGWDGDESTGFEVKATGPWRIEVLPLSATPQFSTFIKGKGDMVVRFTGNGSLAKITGNKTGQYFYVRAFGPQGTNSLIDTTQAYSGSRQISGGPQAFEVQATGSWTITIE